MSGATHESLVYREQDARGTSSATAPRLANVGYLAQDPRYYDCVSTILFSRVCSLARRSRWHRAGVHLRTKPARELRGRIARDLPAAQPWHRGGVGSSRTATPVIRCAGQRRDPQLAVCCGRSGDSDASSFSHTSCRGSGQNSLGIRAARLRRVRETWRAPRAEHGSPLRACRTGG